jgi:hypothetical protein
VNLPGSNIAIDDAGIDLHKCRRFLRRNYADDLATVFAPDIEFFGCAFDHQDATFCGMNRDSAFNDHLASAIAALKLIINDGAKESRAILKRTTRVVFNLTITALVRISL